MVPVQIPADNRFVMRDPVSKLSRQSNLRCIFLRGWPENTLYRAGCQSVLS